jgi:hypothetical protein
MASLAIPLICSLIRFRTLNNELRVLFLYIVVSSVTEVISLQLALNQLQNYVVQNLFTVVECSLLMYIYFLRFEGILTRRLILVLYSVFIIVAFIFMILLGGLSRADNLISACESCLFIALSWSYFYKLMQEKNIERLNQFYFAWINAAILIYFSMTFFVFLFNKVIGSLDNSLYRLIYTLHLFTNISFNILLGIGIWKIKPR